MMFLFAFLITLIVLFSLLFNERKRKRKNPLPPGPRGLSLLGNLLEMSSIPHEYFFKLSNKYGPIMTVKLGMVNTILISSATMAKEILKTHDHVFSGRVVPSALETLGFGDISVVFCQQSEHLKYLRRLCTVNLLGSRILQSQEPIRRLHTNNLIDGVRQHLNSSSSSSVLVEIKDVVSKWVFNVIGSMIFGVDGFDLTSTEETELRQGIQRLLDLHSAFNIADLFPFMSRLDLQGINKKTHSAAKNLFSIVEKLIFVNKHKHSSSHGQSFIKDMEEEQGLQSVVGFITMLFLAGVDTTGTTIEWAMAEVMRNEEILKKAQEELDIVVGRERKVDEGDIEKLKYIKALIKETLRMHPPGPFLIPHRADEEVVVGGYTVPKHSQVIVNAWAIGRDPSSWENPCHFDPQRFLQNKNVNMDYKGQNFELIPFGSGRRICLGLPLATLMIHNVLATLLHSFHWSLPTDSPEIDMDAEFASTLRKATPLRILASTRV